MKNKKYAAERGERLAVKTNIKKATKKAQYRTVRETMDEIDDLDLEFIGNIKW